MKLCTVAVGVILAFAVTSFSDLRANSTGASFIDR